MIQWYSHTSDILLSWVCLTMMVANVVCAIFRWFHMCKPYDANAAHFYPARKLVTAFFLCELLNVPFLLRPSAEVSVIYSASVELLVISAFVAMIFSTFFKRSIPHRRLATILLIWLPMALTGAAGASLLIAPGAASPAVASWLPYIVGIASIALDLQILQIMLWIARQIDGYHKAEFSNAADFPYAFARKVLWLPWIVLFMCWAVLITRSVALLAALWLLLTVLAVYYTIVILHPQIGSLIDKVDAEGEPDGEPTDAGDQREWDQNRDAVRRRVIEIARSRYLEPHLTRRDIVGMFGYGERTLAGEFITSYGFYDMINTLRLEHARRYRELHPDETKESVAINSGFKDRYAMLHAERRVSAIHPDILEGFSPHIE